MFRSAVTDSGDFGGARRTQACGACAVDMENAIAAMPSTTKTSWPKLECLAALGWRERRAGFLFGADWI